ncbi:hypothetical protein PPYR_11317 [Photinus pyralis]|uniref:Single domain-containing protein n=1 Tax=Photinus pyralis TaxID=7054 RepID=A0A1Y1KL05_PHOPY|nr:uncharacterized protein LOC116175338 [Photinus pyralis]XP_031349300.1 uncharacterized protein LOC116175367 [Photinus pyralis]KAB0794478.1 hypothetical protein PPYR_11317 [Photinus pyralis]
MKLLLLWTLLVVLIPKVFSWYALEYINFTKETVDECHSVDPKMEVMKKGEFRPMKDCTQAICGDKGILYMGCTRLEDKNCTQIIEGNSTATYPDCCSQCIQQVNSTKVT